MTAAHLEDRAVIAVSGPEARGFLQGLITNDVEKLAPGTRDLCRAADAAGQDPVRLPRRRRRRRAADRLRRATRATRCVKRLSMYRLRAKVEIEARDQLARACRTGPGGPRSAASPSPIPRLAALGHAQHRRDGRDAGPTLPGPRPITRIASTLGVPEAGDFGSDKMFALDAGSRRTARRRLRQGLLCRPGTDRAHEASRHRAQAAAGRRRRPRRPRRAAVELRAGGHDIGEIVSAYGAARLRAGAPRPAGRSGGAPRSTADGVRVTVTKQAWLFA